MVDADKPGRAVRTGRSDGHSEGRSNGRSKRGSAADGQANRQVLLRLSPEQAETLSALAYLRGCTGTEIARDEVIAFLEATATSERVQRLIRERREYEAEAAGTLRAIDSARPGRSATD